MLLYNRLWCRYKAIDKFGVDLLYLSVAQDETGGDVVNIIDVHVQDF